jgi:hypothetical protein
LVSRVPAEVLGLRVGSATEPKDKKPTRDELGIRLAYKMSPFFGGTAVLLFAAYAE